MPLCTRDNRVRLFAAVMAALASHAAGGEEKTFDIAAQRLPGALKEFGLQSGQPIVFSTETTALKQSPGVRGSYEPDAALEKVLAGTQHSYAHSGAGFVILQTAAAEPQAEVPTPSSKREPSPVASAQAAPEEIVEVQVTASRVVRSGFTAPTPTTIVGAEQLEQRGATNVAHVLNEIPAFKATTTPATNGVRSIFPGSYYADLRGLGASRTLVLVDGKRFVPQITTGLSGYQVDLNQVPALLVERAEVVTGGASAQWGSDAVAGVVNLITKKNFEGFQSEAQFGEASEGDNQERRFGVLAGTAFMGGRAHVVGAIDSVRNDGVGDAYTRDWGAEGWGILVNPCPLNAAVSATCPSGGNGLAQNLILPDVRYATSTNGGLINNTALRGTQFGPGGTTAPFLYGNFAGTQFMQGGGSNDGLNIYTDVPLAAANRRTNGYARLSFDLTDNVSAFLEGSYGDGHGLSRTLPPRNEANTPITISINNAFLPDAVRQQMLSAGITSFNLGRNSKDVGNATSSVRTYTRRVVAGFEGTIGEWNWDAAFINGHNNYTQHVFTNRILSNFRFATDAVLDGQGNPVCRATLPGPAFNPAAAGCVPLNVFGPDAASAEAIDYVTGTLRTQTEYDQNAAAVNFSGEPLRTWAGPLSVAAGLEWRSEEQDTAVDPLAETAQYESTNARSVAGKFNVKEGYVETVIPLAKSFDLNGAVRQTDYSTSGSVRTWKAGATYSPVPGLLLRAARSRDIRAPNIFELYTPPVSTITSVRFATGVGGGPAGQVATQQLIGGNADLDPEVAKTTTLGFSYAPPFVPGLQLSVDRYDIKIEGAIANLTTLNVADLCVAGDPYYCSFISRNPAGSASVYTITTPFQNLNEIQRTGYDFEASYRRGPLTFRFSGNRVSHFRENVNGAGFIERAGETVSSPHFIGTSSVTYEIGPASVTTQVRYIGSGKYNNTWTEGIQINDNTVASATYINLSGSYRFNDSLELFGVVNNLADRDPPIAPQNFSYPTINTWFDMVGRSYRLGFRYKF